MFNAVSDGEGSKARVFSKGSNLELRDEAASLVRLRFQMGFSSLSGFWDTAVDVPINTTIIGAVIYDANSIANTPTLYLWDGSVLSTRIVGDGLTVSQAPVGIRTSNVGTALTIGNNPGQNFTFDGRVDEIMLFTDILTSREAFRLIALARMSGTTLGAALSGAETLKEGAA